MRFWKLCLVSLCFILAGCTAALWRGFPYPSYQHIGEDKLLAFGQSITKGEAQLAMLGERYWYVIDPKQHKVVLEVLKAELPQPFQFHSTPNIQVNIQNEKDFSANFSLFYPAKSEFEINKITALGFQYSSDLKLFGKNFDLSGKIYKTTGKEQLSAAFNPPISVDLYLVEEKRSKNNFSVLQKIALTPATLVFDIFYIILK